MATVRRSVGCLTIVAVAAAAGHLVGKESELFRFTVKHSFIMLGLICCIVFAQAYAFSYIIPTYEMLQAGTAISVSNVTLGFVYLIACAATIALFALALKFMNRKNVQVLKN